MKTQTMQSFGMNKELQKKEARELFNNLETPLLKYGQGIQVLLKELDVLQVIAKVNEEERMTIEAPQGVIIRSIQELNQEELETYTSLISATENKFLALHFAILDDWKIIIIPRDMTVKGPIIITSHISKKAKAESIIVIAEVNAKAEIIERSSSTEEAYYKSQTVQIFAKENAHIMFSSIQELSPETYNFVIKRGKVEANANITWLDATLGSKYTHLRVQTHLTSLHANTENYSLYFNQGKQIFDLNTESLHKTRQTNSNMLCKGVITENARTIYQGRILIEKDSKNCKAKQKSENLLIDEHARCDAVPILEVENDEVQCSHGATIGKLNEENIFYFTARGIEENIAKQMIIAGFLEPIINKFPTEEIQEHIRKNITERITK